MSMGLQCRCDVDYPHTKDLFFSFPVWGYFFASGRAISVSGDASEAARIIRMMRR
jgi:hypothetical protein